MKAFSIRTFPSYKAWDLAIDSILLEFACYVLMYLVWLRYEGFDQYDFMYG